MEQFGFTREEFEQKLNEIIENPDLMLDVKDVSDMTDIPLYRIRYMNTAGGMQLCIKECRFRGEGSGVYYPLNDKEGFISYFERVMGSKREFSIRRRELMSRRPGFEKDLADKLGTPAFKLQVYPNSQLPTPFARYLNNDQNLANAETVTLTLNQ